MAQLQRTAPCNQGKQQHSSLAFIYVGLVFGMLFLGYSNTNLVVPANSVVTVTLHNYDLGDTLFPAGSPFGKVQGTVGNVAAADGTMYAALALDKIAHTFTITQLGINVPIPGDAPKGASYASVTFTFHTGKAGVYTFRCFDPCGTGTSGWMGPMLTKGYMVGTLTVQ